MARKPSAIDLATKVEISEQLKLAVKRSLQ